MKALKAPNADVLQELAVTAMQLCRAHSAAIGIAERHDGQDVFRWHAAAGQWPAHLGNTIPRDAGPWTVSDGNTAVLMRHAERRYFHAHDGVPPLVETLLVPFEVGGKTVGTVCVVAHDESRMFDREDVRVMTSLSEFASVAYQVVWQQTEVAEALDRELTGSHLLQSISRGVIAGDDIGAFYDQILDAATAIMSSQFASLQMVDRKGDLKLLAWRGFHAQSARFWQTVRFDSITSCGSTLRARQRFIITDTEQSEQLAGTDDLAEYRRSGIRSMQSTPLMSRTGTLIGVVSTHWDQPHIPSEDELRTFDILARQTADLIELANTEAALREVDRRKDEFLAVLGHELRNPLAPLSIGIDLLQRAGNKPELAENIHSMMQRQVSHLTRLVDDLLDLSRVTRGAIQLQRAPIELRVVIEAAVELTRPILDQRSHQLVVELGAATMPLHGDFERLTQVFANLLSNAAKYMDVGGKVTLRSTLEANQVVARVQDCGYGIPPQRLEQVFEMFSQVPEHRARRGGGGLGIGLALSRRLVELHGGSLTAVSDGLGCGSEFVVRLPLNGVAVSVQGNAPQARDTATVPRRILVVDDNVDAAASLRAVLDLGGHTVEVAHDARSSLGLLDSFGPEVLLLDIGLPQMDGYQLAKHIRSMPGGDKLLLVAITGWGQASDRDRAREAGFDEHMTKPIRVQALEAVLARGDR